MNKKKIIAICIIGVVFAASFLFYGKKDNSLPKNFTYRNILIGNSAVKAEVAATPESRERGLSGRTELQDGSGMLFIFDKPDFYHFWMKEMNFPIDIIWMNENLEIIDITKKAEPESFPQTFSPQKPAKFVLEVNAGWADRRAVKTGVNVKISP